MTSNIYVGCEFEKTLRRICSIRRSVFCRGRFLKDPAQLFQRVFFNPGHIGAADVQLGSDDALSLLGNAEKPVAETDHLIFLGGEKIFHGGSQAADVFPDRKSTRLNSSHIQKSRMPSSA